MKAWEGLSLPPPQPTNLEGNLWDSSRVGERSLGPLHRKPIHGFIFHTLKGYPKTSLTFRARASGVKGFSRNSIFGSSTPWWAMMSSVYPDM